MSNRQKQCFDKSRLEMFLNERLDENDESQVLDHINTCKSCQSALENIAAGKDGWKDLQNQLAEHLDLDVSLETAPFMSRDRDIEMEKLKEYLGPTDNPDMLGRLGSYEVCGLVGRGSTGVVVKALDTRLNRFVAIKVLSPSFSSNGPARTRFEREGRSVAAVSHEHVVPIHSVNEYRGLPYIVMHYVDGGSLHQRIEKNGPLETCEVVRIGMQIAKGLAAAHGQGIIHRDVKPANVMLESGVDRAMVSDFGLARVADEAAMTRSGVIAGTPQYMSPEQAMGDPIDPRSDLFSLGSVLYAACTGRAPFRSETVFGVIKRVCESKPRPIREINPKIDSWLEAIISKLHEKDREDRFESAEQVAEILNRELAHLQSPSFVAVPDRPWFAPVAPVKPKKAKRGSNATRFAVAALVMLVASFSALALSGMVHFGPKTQMSDQTTETEKTPVAAPQWDAEVPESVTKFIANSKETGRWERPAKRWGTSTKTLASTKAPTSWVSLEEKQSGKLKEQNEDMKLEFTITSEESSIEICTENSCNKDEERCEDCGGCKDCNSSIASSSCESECTGSSCNSECETKYESSCNKEYEVVIADRGMPGRLVAVERKLPGKIVDGYMVYLPMSYEETEQDYPVIMFLTGGCGVGGEISNLKCWCLPRSIQQQLNKGDVDLEDEHKKLMMDSFIVVAPHMRGGSFDERQFFDQEEAIGKILDEVEREYRAKSNQVYLTGTGRGGHGTWGLASRMSQRFAAIAPIRGMRFGINNYAALTNLPIWVGHDEMDEEVEYEETAEIISKLEAIDNRSFTRIKELELDNEVFDGQTRLLTSRKSTDWPDLYASAPLYKWFLQFKSDGKMPVQIVADRMETETPAEMTVAIIGNGKSDGLIAVANTATVTNVETKNEANEQPKTEKELEPEDDEDLEVFESNVEQSVPVTAGGKLLVRSHMGHVTLKMVDGNEVQFLLRRKVKAESQEAADKVFNRQVVDFDLDAHEGFKAGTDAAITVRASDDYVGWGVKGLRFEQLHLEIGVPKEFNVDVRTTAGHISAPDLLGMAKLRTSGGHIEIAGCSKMADLHTSGGHLKIGDVDGELVAKTSGGHIKVANVSGKADLKTSGGNIKVKNSDGAVDAKTSGGNIEIILNEQPKEDMDLKTSAGQIKVGIRDDIKLDVYARTTIGSVSGNAIENPNGKNQAKFSINGGGPKLQVQTSVGNVEVYYLENGDSTDSQ